MKNRTMFVLRQLIACGALLLFVGGLGAAQAQTSGPAPAPTQPDAADSGGMGHGMGGMMGGMDHGGMSHGGMGGKMGGMGHGGAMGGMDHGAMIHGGGMSNMSHGGAMMKEMMCGFAEHLEARLAYLKTELKITDQQTPQWNAFADAWRAVAQKASTKCAGTDDRQRDEKQGVLGKLSMMEAHMADHLELVRAQKAALEPLFNVLSDDQKKAADETLTRVMKVGMSMGGGGMGGMDHGGMSHGGMSHGGMGGMMGGMGGMSHGGGMQH